MPYGEPSRSPAQAFDSALLLQAQPVRVLLLDVDGVLTDGRLFFGAEGETLKAFHTLDGHGLKLLAAAGVVPAVISGRDSPALRARLDALGLRHRVLGTEVKAPAAEGLLRTLGLEWTQAAAMGDDWPDLPLLSRAALAVAPPNAHVEVRRRAHWLTPSPGGHGAVRELCDLLLAAHGAYAQALQHALGTGVDQADGAAA
jgi:3-deoxy-D-manno-octulosonate 8-phosphate phosphatase (KDO 8-P phosphatase)